MKKYRLAVPTVENKGLKDVISNVFARAPTFTFIDILDGEIQNVKVEINKDAKLKQGSGPIVSRKLKDKGIDVVIAGEFGPGVSTVLEMNEIKMIKLEPGIKVREAIDLALKDFKNLINNSF